MRVGVRIDQRVALAIDVPGFFLGVADAAHVGGVAGGKDHAVLCGADDGGRLVQPIGLDHQGADEKRLDRRRRNARDLLLASDSARTRGASFTVPAG